MINFLKKRPSSSLLGLSFDGNRVDGVVLRRTNGSLVVQKAFFANLSLDLLTNDPELVGREIRNHLERAEIRQRQCAVSIPLHWILTLQTKVPDLPEADISSFLQIEAERGFPYGPDALLISRSRYRSPGGNQYATQAAVPRDHLVRLGKALKAAGLKPVTFSPGICAFPGVNKESSGGVITLLLGEKSVGLQVSFGGGVVALRTLEGAIEIEGGQKRLYAESIARELRITLGQLPPDVRDAVRGLSVAGDANLADELVRDIRPRVEPLGLKVERVINYSAEEAGVEVPADAEVSPAFSLAARHLIGRFPSFEFLPPRTSQWRQLTTRYSSQKLVSAGVTAGSVALLIAGLFLFQQWQLSHLRSEWASLSPRVATLENMQQQIRKFRPWFDDSLRNLSILRRLTEAFPADGVVSAKSVEIRELAAVTCSGTARDSQALLKTLDQLRSAKEVADVKVEQLRGKTPLQFTFNFHWGEGGNEH